MAPTTLAHLGDAHLEPRGAGHDAPPVDAPTAFERGGDAALERDVDAVIYTGDRLDESWPGGPTVNGSPEALETLADHDVPLYGIAAEHGRRSAGRWRDHTRGSEVATRLDLEPTVVGDTALYGVDAVGPDDWQPSDRALEPPPADVDCTILCVRELREPSGDGTAADHAVEAVLDQVGVDISGLALGGRRRPASARVDGTAVWCAGGTDRDGADGAGAGAARLLEVDDGAIARRRLDSGTRRPVAPTVTLDGGDGLAGVRDVLDRHDLAETVAEIDLVVEEGAVTADQATSIADEPGVVDVSVGGDRAPADHAPHERAAEVLETAQDAVETAALLGYRSRSGRAIGSAARHQAGAPPDEETTRADGRDDGHTRT